MNEPLAFVIAVMIDPEAAMRERPDRAAASAEAPAAAAPPTATAAPAPHPPPSTALPADNPVAPPPKPKPTPEPWMFEGGAEAGIAAGLAPSVAVGAGVEAILYPPGIPLGFRGYTSIFPEIPFLSAAAEKDGARAKFDMLIVGGGLCPTLRRAVNLMLCVGGQVGALRSHAQTANRGINDDQILPLWNVVLEGRISFPVVKPIGVSGGLGLALPLLRPAYEYRTTAGTSDTLFQVSPVAFTASAGVGFVFP
jgi:hypothetical protein